MIEDHEKFMNIAIKKAYEGMGKGELPFGCCLKYEDIVIATHNSCISDYSPLAHAEISAINQMCNKFKCFNLEKATLYTTTEPCLMCIGAINWSNISCVVYGTPIQSSYELGFDEINMSMLQLTTHGSRKIKIIPNFMRDQCENIFFEWKQKNDIFKRIAKNNSVGRIKDKI